MYWVLKALKAPTSWTETTCSKCCQGRKKRAMCLLWHQPAPPRHFVNYTVPTPNGWKGKHLHCLPDQNLRLSTGYAKGNPLQSLQTSTLKSMFQAWINEFTGNGLSCSWLKSDQNSCAEISCLSCEVTMIQPIVLKDTHINRISCRDFGPSEAALTFWSAVDSVDMVSQPASWRLAVSRCTAAIIRLTQWLFPRIVIGMQDFWLWNCDCC